MTEKEIAEKIYDNLMMECEKIFIRQTTYDDPYAFHKAFEHGQRKINAEKWQDLKVLEKCSEAVHKAYCNYHLKNKGVKYWTKGDYSLLDEQTKQIDRETVLAVFKVLRKLPKLEVE